MKGDDCYAKCYLKHGKLILTDGADNKCENTANHPGYDRD